jgi:predicted type IV restriction endonuclease
VIEVTPTHVRDSLAPLQSQNTARRVTSPEWDLEGDLMELVPARVADRIRTSLKQFQPVLSSAKARDINESDTVVIVADMLQAVFGYDKYSEITSEHMIRGTFCDLAIKLDGKLSFLLEVKAIGTELKDQHVRQAIDYAANQGCEWAALTNGISWKIYKVQFAKPISYDVVIEFDLLTLNLRSNDCLDVVSLMAKECWQKARMSTYFEQRQAMSRFTIAALLLSDTVINVVRRELRRMADVKVEIEQVRAVLQNEVLKREVLEGDRATSAARQVSRAARRLKRKQGQEDTVAQTDIARASEPIPASASDEAA